MEESKLTEDVEQNEGIQELIERAREERMEEEREEMEAFMNSKEANKFRELANKKRKAKGPNPLSALRKKHKLEGGEVVTESGERQKRTRRRRKSKPAPANLSS